MHKTANSKHYIIIGLDGIPTLSLIGGIKTHTGTGISVPFENTLSLCSDVINNFKYKLRRESNITSSRKQHIFSYGIEIHLNTGYRLVY